LGGYNGKPTEKLKQMYDRGCCKLWKIIKVIDVGEQSNSDQSD
jgi:hypothetical protein